ncbi:MAG: hypothetical protein US74_C0023G0007 [Parcubacteria group bacterium GW2011_GWA2_38_13]|nr:MAG: hypothetical protein US74_C0023G0007 [Parcubacteria group bacterium GW2011_GWA2_38_13]
MHSDPFEKLDRSNDWLQIHHPEDVEANEKEFEKACRKGRKKFINLLTRIVFFPSILSKHSL